jgi:hypothetical protein
VGDEPSNRFPKLIVRVRFPSPALVFFQVSGLITSP